MIVVQDTANLLALFLCPYTPWKQRITLDGKPISARTRLDGSWRLQDTNWHGSTGSLRLTIPGASYSVVIFWNDGYKSQNAWYINLEDPLRRTARGFDYMDQILDIVVEPDLKTWRWKDEDELEEAIALGLISQERARSMRVEGENVVRILQSGKSIFSGWENWRPDPSWPVPTLPEDWDSV
jgi:hypothetical protein